MPKRQITYEELRDALAQSSQDIYVRHRLERGDALEKILEDANPKHNLERAEAAIEVLKQLGIWP